MFANVLRPQVLNPIKGVHLRVQKYPKTKKRTEQLSFINWKDFWNPLKRTGLSIPAHAWKLWLLFLSILNTVLWRCDGKWGAFHTFTQCSPWNNGQKKNDSSTVAASFVLCCLAKIKKKQSINFLIVLCSIQQASVPRMFLTTVI